MNKYKDLETCENIEMRLFEEIYVFTDGKTEYALPSEIYVKTQNGYVQLAELLTKPKPFFISVLGKTEELHLINKDTNVYLPWESKKTYFNVGNLMLKYEHNG